MTLFHDISPLNIVIPSPVWELNEEYMAKLSRLVKRAQQTRRTTIRRGLNIRSTMSTRYAMANPSWIPTWIPLDPYKDENPFGPEKPPKPKPKPIETTRFGERAVFAWL